MHVGILCVSVISLTWLLHSLKMGLVITRHDCSTVTNLTMLSLQSAGIYTYKNYFSVIYIYTHTRTYMKMAIFASQTIFNIRNVYFSMIAVAFT